ncbi:MAG: bestrophin family protein [Bacteroidota bacterium]
MLLNKRISILTFIKLIRFDIIAICSYAILVGILDQYSFMSKISVPLAITATIGTAVSLLLSFRTAQSYERWWEARIIWGAIVNDSRTLIRQLVQFIPDSDNKMTVVKKFAERQIVWCFALGESLRKVGFSDKVKNYLEAEKINEINIPNALLNQHSIAFAESGLTEYKQVQVDATLSRLCDAMGKCERIKNTVFPKSYSLLVHLLIYVFATLLPFGLDDKYILVEIILTIIIPLIFIAIERTAIVMQDPFENTPMDTPMTSLSTTIEVNLKQMTGDDNLPSMNKADSYYIM